ncbi:MAG: GNAT family N-acetyltransferase [Cyclobacteriaceae bacterium]
MGIINIRAAVPDEAADLTQLTLRSKAMWGYDDAFMIKYMKTLKIEPGEITANETMVLTRANNVIGFYMLSSLTTINAELDYIYVEPDFTRVGFGGMLFEHARDTAKLQGYSSLFLQSDPNAVGFFEKMGADIIGRQSAWSLPGYDNILMELIF